jgi:hypothetical protein
MHQEGQVQGQRRGEKVGVIPATISDIFVEIDGAKMEYERCKNSPEYFIEQYVGMEDGPHAGHEFDVFKLFPFQKALLRELTLNRKNAIFKPRQMGITDLMLGYALWKMTFNEHKNVLVVTMNETCAADMAKKFRDMHRGLPTFLRHELRTDNRIYTAFANGSTIAFTTGDGVFNKLCSISYHLALFDEVAYIANVRAIMPQVMHALVGNPSVEMVAYSSGKPSKWESVVREFNKITLHWSMHPLRDEEWFEEEYECL